MASSSEQDKVEDPADDAEGDEEIESEGLFKGVLSKKNVKSIIYSVVKDADVQRMLANSLAEDASKLQPATYEPKMTRAKMKQVLAEDGNIPHPWPLSPIKTSSHQVKKTFTELEFPDDDDDEDYDPDKDITADISDLCSDDDESNLSMHTSDVGSPSCTNSPAVSQSADLVLPVMPAKHENLPQTISCMGPPPPVRTSQESERRFFDALDQLDLSDTIAKRTRSQLPLTDTSIETLEAEFVPPDITLDMYEDPEQEEEDPDWQDFLKNLMKDDIPNDDDDDPDADPEYNVLAEPEVEAEDDHVLPTRVTKSEINHLMDELYEHDSQDNDEDSQDASVPSFNKPKPLPINKSMTVRKLIDIREPSKEFAEPLPFKPKRIVETAQAPPEPQLPTLTAFERRQLTRQMQCFVQILAQQAILAQAPAPKLHNQSVHFLRELNAFYNASPAGKNSMFNVCNLMLALDLTSRNIPADVEDKGEKKGVNTLLTGQQRSTLALSPVCMYPELLPSHQFKGYYKTTRAAFHHSEDVLICLGLHEFERYKNKCQLISKYLLPVFSPITISTRINNQSKTQKMNKTTIGLYKCKGIIPGLIEFARQTKLDNIMQAPVDQHYESYYPDWLKNIVKKDMVITDDSIAANTLLATIVDKPSITSTQSSQSTAVADSMDINTNTDTSTADSTTIVHQPTTSTPTVSSVTTGAVVDTQTHGNQVTPADVPPLVHKTDNSQARGLVLPTTLNVQTQPDSDTPLVEHSESSMLGILSDMSRAFSSSERSADVSNVPHNLTLVTPTKRIRASLLSPGSSPSPKKYRRLMTSPLKTPEKVYEPIDKDWKMRKHSPRRMELRSKVHSIMPKSFVATVYNQSPTKKAAKAISDKALNRATQITKYQSPLKRAPADAEKPTDSAAKETSAKPAAALTKRTKKKVTLPDDEDDLLSAMIEETGSAKSKSSRKHRYIACLAPDIIETDPQKIEREDLFSRWYIDKVKETLGEFSTEYAEFLQALIAFGKQRKNPAIFYEELKSTILKGREELLQGFAAFLLPAQAVACGMQCYKACIQFNQARRFLRKVEVYFGAASKTFQKLIKLLSPQNSAQTSTTDLRTAITTLLKSHPALLEDFTNFFPDAPPPKRHKEDYEEMDLTEYDDETVIDEFEEMEIAEVEPTNATSKCKCTCHAEEDKPKAYERRTMHCENCRITVMHSRLFIHAGPRKGLRPAYVRYLNPLPSLSDTDDEDSKDSDIGCESPTNENAMSPSLTKASSPLPQGRLAASPAQHTVIAEKPWARFEDAILLEMMKVEAMKSSEGLALTNDLVTAISCKLKNRTNHEIKGRLETLLQLLSQNIDEDSAST